jgi:GT2 family glycosyltransferase
VEQAPDISIVIPNWNGRDLLAACLESLRRTAGDLRVETIVVDNFDDSPELVRTRFPEVRLLVNERNEGFARACNRGAAAANAPFILLLNSDTVVQAEALQRLLALGRGHAEAAVVGAQLRNPDGSFQSSHSPFPNLWLDWMMITGLGRWLHGPAYPCADVDAAAGPQPGDWVGGACMMVQRDVWRQLAGFDDGFTMYCEETDFCYRAQAGGWQVWYEPGAVVTHVGGGSSKALAARGEALLYRSRLRFYRLHYGVVQARLARWLFVGAMTGKIALHSLLRRLSQGRRGRQVVSLRLLLTELRGA